MTSLSPLRTTLILLMAINSVTTSKKNQQQGVTKMDMTINGPLLLNELLLDYDSFSRPASNTDKPCTVHVTLKPGLATWKDEQLKTGFALQQEWMDERLKFTGEKEIKLSDTNSRLWLPDTMFSSLESHSNTHGLIIIEPQGLIRWTQQVLLSFPCPFEPSEVWSSDGVINCTLTLSSRSYSGSDLKYVWARQFLLEVTDPRFSQLRKVEFVGGRVHEQANDIMNATSNHSTLVAPEVAKVSELKVLFTVQTDFTKSVLRFLTKKAMRDL